MNKLLLSLFALLIGTSGMYATSVVVSGNISSNATWTADTVKVTGNLTVNSGISLTIQAGTRVEVSNAVHIDINGKVLALGNATDSIYFYAPGGATWRGIIMDNQAGTPDTTAFRYCSFKGSRSNFQDGGVFYLFEIKKLILSHCLFQNNLATGEGGSMYMFDSDPLIEHCRFAQNTAGGHGGAISIESSQNITKNSVPHIKACHFLDNSASSSYGGAIYGYRGSVDYVIEDCVFRNNLGGRGGALTFVGTDPVIRNNIISNNTADQHEGGALYLGDANALVEHNRIDSNYAYSNSFQSRGGAIYIRFSNVDILENHFKGNESGYGGAISLEAGSTADIKGNVLDSNRARTFGSAVYGAGGFGGSVTMRIDSNLIVNNLEVSFSYALFTAGSSSEMEVTRNTIENNQAGGVGYGPGYSAFNYAEVRDNLIRYNGGYGVKAAYVDVLDNVITHNGIGGIEARETAVIRDNTIAYNKGSGIEVNNGDPQLSIESNEILWNVDSSDAGGIDISSGDVRVVNNIIRNNYGTKGGGIEVVNAAPQITGNLVSHNSAAEGGGVYVHDGSSNPVFINNTIVHNEASGLGGGVYHRAQNPINFTNTILWGNVSGSVTNQLYVYYDNHDPNFYHCDIQGGVAAFDLNFGSYGGIYQNTLDTLPGFLSPTSGTGFRTDSLFQSRWSLVKQSPLIDAGTPDTAGQTQPVLDLGGSLRIQNDTIDMGAYERLEDIKLIGFTRNYTVCEGESVMFQVQSSVNGVRFNWSKNGVVLQDSTLNTYSLQTADLVDSGFYQVRLSTGADTLTDSLFLQVYSRPVVSSLGPDAGICAGDTFRLNADPGYADYLWNNGSRDTTIAITQSGVYYYEAENSSGCKAYSDSIRVNLLSNYSIDLGSEPVLCGNDSVSLGVVVAGANYLWNTSDTTATIYVTNPGTYWVQLTDTNGCAKTDTIAVWKDSTDLQLPDTLHVTSTALITLYTPAGFSNVVWNTGATGDTLILNPAQGLLPYYSVSAISPLGCALNDTVYITNTIGLKEWPSSGVNIYPNPAGNRFFVERPAYLQGDVELEIHDLSGQKIPAIVEPGAHIFTIELKARAGCYIISLKQKDIQLSSLILVQP